MSSKKTQQVEDLPASPPEESPAFFYDAIASVLGGLYNIYYRFLKMGGVSQTPHAHVDELPLEERLLSLDQTELDLRATRVGAAYRGIGVLVGLLGALIILCALLPLGLNLSEPTVLTVGILELVLMTSLVILLLLTRKLGLKDRWVQLRRAAEYKRYETLRSAIHRYANDQGEDDFALMKAEVSNLLGGSDQCQIRYNAKKKSDYEGIETFAVRLTYLAFMAAFMAAAAHFVLHAKWLIFFTAYAPALIGAMHAVNNFLRLPQLVDQHGEMMQLLQGLQQRLPVDTLSVKARDDYLALSRQLLALLERADDSWKGIAAHQDLHPV